MSHGLLYPPKSGSATMGAQVMRWANKLFFGILVFYVIAIIAANRDLFFSKFDPEYWKDKYDHSQWGLPLSVRTIGDDGLYLYQGYALTRGADPTRFNAEVPPLGKYLIGMSIATFGNGYWFGLITNISLLVLFYALAKKLFPTGFIALALTTLVATDPLITDQYRLTMLDALQSVWLLLSLYCFIKYTENTQTRSILLLASGVSLGFFAETKFPLLLPIPLLLIGLSLIKRKNFLRQSAIFLAGIGAGYLAPYVPYFLAGHTFIEWLRIQKWIVSFYLHSKLSPTYGSVLVNLLTGQYQNLYSREWLSSPHWSPVWTLLTIGIVASFSKHTIKNALWRNTLIMTLATISIYAVIPFWTRYLTLTLPFLYLLFGFTIHKLKPAIAVCVLSICILINISSSVSHFYPSAQGTMSLFTYNWNNNFFQDMYEDIDSQTRAAMSREHFRVLGMRTIAEGEIEKTEVTYTFPHVSRFATHVKIPVVVTYITRHLGSFTTRTTIPLVKENNRWKIQWNWDMYIKDMTDRTHLATTVQEAKRGSIIASDKSILASDIPSFMIWITPKRIVPAEEKALLLHLENLFERKILAVYFHQRLYGNALSELPVPMGVIPKVLTKEEKDKLVAYHGVLLSPHAGRHAVISDFTKIGSVANSQFFECCSYLYTTTNYDGVDGVEKDKNETLKGENGGTLQLVDVKGNVISTLINRIKKNGSDVQP